MEEIQADPQEFKSWGCIGSEVWACCPCHPFSGSTYTGDHPPCPASFSTDILTYSIFIPQFHWGTPGEFEVKNSIVDPNFDNFVENVCKWIEVKAFGQVNKDNDGTQFSKCGVNKSAYASTTIWEWNEVPSGPGAYSAQELLFQAGLFIHTLLSPRILAQTKPV